MRRPLATLRAGFTLIELLAVMMIIGILATFLLPNIMGAFDQTRVTACRANLSTIYQGLMNYQAKYKRWPTYDGAQFFCCLIDDGVWENTEQYRKRLTCPEIEQSTLLSLEGRDPEEWYADIEDVDGGSTTYAGRSKKDMLRRKTPKGTEVMVADDNDGGMNHNTTTLALMMDGVVREYEIVELQNKDRIDEEEEWLEVGPGSPLPELQKLSLD